MAGTSLVVSALVTYFAGIPGFYGAVVFVGLTLVLTGLALLALRFAFPARLFPGGQGDIQYVSVRGSPPVSPPKRKRVLKDDETYVRGEHMLLAEIGEREGLLSRTFEDCDLYGPALLLPLNDVTFTGPTFDIPDSDVNRIVLDRASLAPKIAYWRVLPYLVGAIAVSDCRFLRCRFHQVSLAVDQTAWEDMRRAWGAAFDVVLATKRRLVWVSSFPVPSKQSHLHVHVQDRAALFGSARGLPVVFRGYLADGRQIARGTPVQGQFARAVSR